MNEGQFKRQLIKKLKELYPGAIILKNDANSVAGIPDHLFLYENYWAAFEAKRSMYASHRPNQEHWINVMNRMSFASFVFPENEGWFLNELQRSFKSRGRTRISIGF